MKQATLVVKAQGWYVNLPIDGFHDNDLCIEAYRRCGEDEEMTCVGRFWYTAIDAWYITERSV